MCSSIHRHDMPVLYVHCDFFKSRNELGRRSGAVMPARKELRDASFVLLGEVREGRNTTTREIETYSYVQYVSWKQEHLSFTPCIHARIFQERFDAEIEFLLVGLQSWWAHAIPNIGAFRIKSWERATL